MRKIYSLLIAFSFFASVASAKTTSNGMPSIFPHFGVAPNGPGTTRLIGYTYSIHNGVGFVPHDSSTYSYSWGRGGLLNLEDMDDNFVNFDHSYTYLYVPATGSYRNQYHRSQVFNTTNGKAEKYYCQSWNLSTNLWRDSAKFGYTYTGNDLLDNTVFSIFKSGNWSPHVTYQNFYAGNKLTRMVSTVFSMFFNYDASGNLISREDSVQGISIPWHRYGRISFGYDASNRVVSDTGQVEDNGNWKNDNRHDYTYIGNNITEATGYTWNGISWEISDKHIFTYDQNNNKLIDEYQRWDATTSSFNSYSREKWTYNITGQPETYYSETYEPSSGNWINIADDFFYRYYYEQYSPTSTNDVNETVGIKLYPQPAQNALNVEIALNQPASYTAEIFDIRGTAIKTVSGSSNERNNINVSDLANGNYIVRISTAQGQYAKQFMIAR